jgi:hypothetical protein
MCGNDFPPSPQPSDCEELESVKRDRTGLLGVALVKLLCGELLILAKSTIRHAHDRHRFDQSTQIVAHPVLNGLHHEYSFMARAA